MKYSIKLSKSRVKETNERGLIYANAYILMRELHQLYKHPYILDFNAKRTLIRQKLGYTDKQFRITINEALREGYAYYRGTTLYFLSNNQDKKLRTRKKSDFVSTKTVRKTFEQIIVAAYYKKQQAKISFSLKQTPNSKATASDFERIKLNAPQIHQQINHDITLSCRALAKLLNRNSPAYGFNKRKELVEAGFINLHSNKVAIRKEQAIELIKKGCHNIRRDKETDIWFYVLADKFDVRSKGKESYCKKGTLYTDM